MIYSILFTLCSLLSPTSSESNYTSDLEASTVRIYFSPLSTQDHIDKVKADLQNKSVEINIKDETFSSNGYLLSYVVSISKSCKEGIDLIDVKTDIPQEYLGAIVIGEDCQSGSMNFSINKPDITDWFFTKSPPVYEYFTWDGGKEALDKLKDNKIFEKQRR